MGRRCTAAGPLSEVFPVLQPGDGDVVVVGVSRWWIARLRQIAPVLLMYFGGLVLLLLQAKARGRFGNEDVVMTLVMIAAFPFILGYGAYAVRRTLTRTTFTVGRVAGRIGVEPPGGLKIPAGVPPGWALDATERGLELRHPNGVVSLRDHGGVCRLLVLPSGRLVELQVQIGHQSHRLHAWGRLECRPSER